MKKISVIVPVYNVERYLRKCFDSLINQTLKDIEFIIVNDGSSDNSQQIIDEYVKKDKRFKSIVKANGGQGSARNVGLELAKGEYIAYVDSDDYIADNMYEKMYLSSKKNDSDIVICGNYVVNEEGKILRREFLNISGKLNKEQKSDVLFDKMAVWNKIYKRSFLKSLNISFRENKWYEDFDFSMKVLLSTNNIFIIDDCLYYYLQRNGSTMNNNNIKRNLEILNAFDEILNFMKDCSIYKKNQYEIEYIAILHIYLATNVRIICSKVEKKEQMKYVKMINGYFYKMFPKYEENKYLEIRMSKSKKIIMKLLHFRMYSLIRLIFKVKK